MNRDQKASAVAEIAESIKQSDAVFVVDYRGLTVTQAAELRGKLRDQDATLAVTKNTLVGIALSQDDVDAEDLRQHLAGPNALTFVRGDVAAAAKIIADFARANELPQFKGGIVEGQGVDADQLRAIAKLPSRDVLYQQLVGVVASPISGLARTLNALLAGVAVALGGVRDKMESGELPSGDAPAAAADQTEAAPAADSAEADDASDADPATDDAGDAEDTTSAAGADTDDQNEGGSAA